jgi:hypothetical protein
MEELTVLKIVFRTVKFGTAVQAENIRRRVTAAQPVAVATAQQICLWNFNEVNGVASGNSILIGFPRHKA